MTGKTVTMQGIYAVNGSVLNIDDFHLVNISEDDIASYFHIVAQGENVLFLKLDKEAIQSRPDEIAKQIRKSVAEIAKFLAKGCGDIMTEKRINEEVWTLTWGWYR